MIPGTAYTQAQTLRTGVPALLAQARELALSIQIGGHGRRRSGTGSEFWQFREAMSGDSLRQIDWRRSGRGDTPFVRETEWQTPQKIQAWVDPAASMAFSSGGDSKHHRAAVLALAVLMLADDAQEQVSLLGQAGFGGGAGRLTTMADQLTRATGATDHTTPLFSAAAPHSWVIGFSDFLGDLDALNTQVTTTAALGVRGALMMVLDPQESDFPFQGRTRFQSVSGATEYDAQKAQGIRADYLDALAERQVQVKTIAQNVGWDATVHRTDAPALDAVLWVHQVVGQVR